MKKIIIRKEHGEPIIIYVSDKVFAHMRIVLTTEQQTSLLEFIAIMLAKTGKAGNHYLQYAYFNPAGNNQLKLYYARESDPKNIVQMNPVYDAQPDDILDFSIQIEDATEQEKINAKEKMKASQTAVKAAITGENNPPFHKQNEQLMYVNEDSRERKKAAAIKLFKLHNKAATDVEAEQFAEFVITPEAAFNPEIREFSSRDELTQMGQFITAISQQNNQESAELRKYRATLADHLQRKLDSAQQSTIGIITDAVKQLDSNDKRMALQAKIEAYTALKDARGLVISKLVTAVYNAAKEYYLNIWQHDKYSLDNEIQAFNAIFGKIIKIDPANLSLSSIESVFAKLNAGKMKTDDIEKIITDILNNAYGTIGSQKRQQNRDAIEFLIKHFNQVDSEHAYFPKIERLHTKHQFRFSDSTRNQLLAFDDTNQELLTADKNDIDEIYLTGTSLLAVAHEVKEASQSKFNNLTELTTVLNISRENLRLFPAIVEQKNQISRRLSATQAQCPNLQDLPFLQAPVAANALGELSQVVAELDEIIHQVKTELERAVQTFHDEIQAQQYQLNSIVASAGRTAVNLTPLSSVDIDNAFTDADENAKGTKTHLNKLQSQIGVAELSIQNLKKDTHDILQCQLLVNALYNLAYWQTTTGTFGIQAKVTHNGQSYVVPREIGDMLRIVKSDAYNRSDSDPDTARTLIANLQDYADHHRTRNPDVNRLYDAIRSSTQLNKISSNIQNMGTLLPQQLTRITDDQTNTTEVAPSRFWQRHPVLKKALLGALIGTIVPVVGTIIGLIVGTVIGKRDEKRAQQPLRGVSTNPFDTDFHADRDHKSQTDVTSETTPLLAEEDDSSYDDVIPGSTSQMHDAFEKRQTVMPATASEQAEEDIPEVDFSGLDEMMAQIDNIDPTEALERLSNAAAERERLKAPNPSLFDPKAAEQQKCAFENDFVSNLLKAVYESKARETPENLLPSLKSDIETLREKKNWDPKEINQATRDIKLKNLIEILQWSYRSTCTEEFIKDALQMTAQQHPQLNKRMFDNSPLKKFGIQDIVSGMQKNKLM